MKKVITILLFLLSITLFAQQQQRSAGSLTVLSDRGVKFKLYLNGELQNRTSKEIVRTENLTQRVYSAKIKFENNSLPILSENNIAISGRNNSQGTEFYNVTYKITVDRRNNSKLMLVSKEPIYRGSNTSPDIVYGNGGKRPPVQIVYPGTSNGNVGNRPPYGGGRPQFSMPMGCAGSWEMGPADFQRMKNAVNSETFNSDKIKLLKRLIPDNCLSTNQISELMKTYFTFDSERLDFAIMAYDYCVDPKNYYLLNPLLSFSSSKDKLYEHIDSRG